MKAQSFGCGGRCSVVKRDGKFPGLRLQVGDRAPLEIFCPPPGASAIER